MKNKNILKSIVLLVMASSLSACQAVEGIFKAGMGVGAFMVIAVVGVVIFLIARLFKTKNP
jgi:hypothetical protein